MPVLLILALLLAAATGIAQQSKLVPALGTIDGATAESVDPTEFVLDAAPERIEAIATRHNLTILRTVNLQGRGIYLS
jgi:hypothetical protein